MEAKTDFHVVTQPSFNTEIYIRDILEPYIVLYAPSIGEILLEANCFGESLKATEIQCTR